MPRKPSAASTRSIPYDSGLAYNQEIAAAKAQAELGWTVELTRADDAGVTQITVNVKDKTGKPVGGLDASLAFHFPATRKFDRDGARDARSPKASIPAPPNCAPDAGRSNCRSIAAASACSCRAIIFLVE